MNHYQFLALSKLANHFSHDWGQWFHCDKLRPWKEDWESMDQVYDAWWKRRNQECSFEGLCDIGTGPSLSHTTGSGRYSWVADPELNTLTLEINRASESDPSINEVVAKATIQYDSSEWRGTIQEMVFSDRAELRHVGYMLELLIVVQDAHSTSHLLCELQLQR